MNIKLIARYIGIALLFNALFMFISLGVSALNGFDSSFSPLLLSGLITAMVGCFPLIFVRGQDDVNLREGFAITIFSWVLSCIFGMLPYVMWGGEFTLPNAWYESVSGYTTTGGTILMNVEALPKGLLFWRSSTHFIGGMGVMVFMLLVLPSMSTFRMRISKIEISSISKDNYRYRSKETVRVIASTYIGITVAGTVALVLAGMSFFDAVNHAMSIVSTGGFSTRNASILYYDSLPIEIVCVVFMYVSTLHFGMVYALVVKRSTALLKSPVFRYFMGFCLVMSLLIGLDLKASGQIATYGEAMRQGFFQYASIVSSTGFATADTSVWPLFSIFLLLFAMYHGGCSGSTCGGVKADRMWIFYKVLKNNIFKQLHPNAVIPVKVNADFAYRAGFRGIILGVPDIDGQCGTRFRRQRLDGQLLAFLSICEAGDDSRDAARPSGDIHAADALLHLQESLRDGGQGISGAEDTGSLPVRAYALSGRAVFASAGLSDR